jgi:hypothetical protein
MAEDLQYSSISNEEVECHNDRFNDCKGTSAFSAGKRRIEPIMSVLDDLGEECQQRFIPHAVKKNNLCGSFCYLDKS